METWQLFKPGDMVTFGEPAGEMDKNIAAMKCGRMAAFIGYTDPYITPYLYARVSFHGDAKGLEYLVHPESLILHYKAA